MTEIINQTMTDIKWGDVIKNNAIINNKIYNDNKSQMHSKIIEMLKEMNIDDTLTNIKCKRCKIYRKEIDFYNENGREMKTCARCRFFCKRNQKLYYEKKKSQQLKKQLIN